MTKDERRKSAFTFVFRPSSGAMLRLYLVRHGESAWNELQLYTGQQNVPLSEKGHAQAQRLAERMHMIPLEQIYASPLLRAHDTAKPIAESKNMPLCLDERLAEIHHGEWEGNPASVIREQYEDTYRAWRNQPHTVTMPDGESLNDVSQRVQLFLQDALARHHEGNVLIVSHDAVLRVIVVQTLLMGLEYFWRWRFDNASLSVLERVQDGHFRLALLNDIHYLHGVHTNCEAQAL